MDFNFLSVKQKDVISVTDGRHLGKVCDISFSFPEGNLLGFTVTGCKGFKFSRQEVFLPLGSVVKIGEDAILVKTGKKDECPPRGKNCPPPCPPPDKDCPPRYPPRRNLDEYE